MATKNELNQNYDPWQYSSDNVGYISKKTEVNETIQKFFANAKYNEEDEKIYFYNIKEQKVGSIDVNDFPSSTNSDIISNDNSITVTTEPTSTDIAVNIKSGEKVIKLGDNGIYTDIKISALTASEINVLPNHSNIKEAYKLLDSEGNQLGDVIKIYKESSLYNAYIGHVDDTLTSPQDPTVINGSGDTALCFIYQKSDGTYELVALNIAQILQDLEFSSGLTVENNVVKVLVDPSSEEFLTVSSNGVKLSGIEDAIDNSISGAIGTLKLTSDSATTGQYIAAIEENNGIVGVKTRANVSEATLNNYTKGEESTKIEATDTINEAFSKLENQISGTTIKIEKATSANHLTLIQTSDSGPLTYTIGENNIASNSDLVSEINVRKLIEGQTAQTYTPNTNAIYISGATSLTDADDKLDIALENEVNRATTREGILQEAITHISEQFLIVHWDETFNISVPPVTLDIDNIDIPKFTFKTSGDIATNYQIVGMIAYEIFGVDGKRLNYIPVCQFTGQRQTELHLRGCVMGNDYKTATKIAAWVLLKYR